MGEVVWVRILKLLGAWAWRPDKPVPRGIFRLYPDLRDLEPDEVRAIFREMVVHRDEGWWRDVLRRAIEIVVTLFATSAFSWWVGMMIFGAGWLRWVYIVVAIPLVVGVNCACLLLNVRQVVGKRRRHIRMVLWSRGVRLCMLCGKRLGAAVGLECPTCGVPVGPDGAVYHEAILRDHRRLYGWVWAVLMVGLVAPAAGVFWHSMRGEVAWTEALAAARADGEPLMLAEIESRRRVWPKKANGALYFQSFGDDVLDAIQGDDVLLRGYRPMEWTQEMLGRLWRADDCRQVGERLEAASEWLALIDGLAGYDGGRFPMPVDVDVAAVAVPYGDALRASVKLKSLQVRYRANMGDLTQLAEDVTVLQRHGQLLLDQPFLLSSLVRIGCHLLWVEALEDACALGVPSSECLARVERVLADCEEDEGLYWAMLGDRAYFTEMGALAFDAVEIDWPVRTLADGWVRHNQAAVLGSWTRVVGASHNTRQCLGALEEAREAYGALLPYHRGFSICVPSSDNSVRLHLVWSARCRSARVAMAAERYRANTGAFPERLDALVPAYIEAVPKDPFDDQPLRYTVQPDRVVVYSVGLNGVDDGGALDCGGQWCRWQDQPDVGFTLLPIARRARSVE